MCLGSVASYYSLLNLIIQFQVVSSCITFSYPPCNSDPISYLVPYFRCHFFILLILILIMIVLILAESDWKWSRSFEVTPAQTLSKHLALHLEGVDTIGSPLVPND